MNGDFLDYGICKQITESSNQCEIRMMVEKERLEAMEKEKRETIGLWKLGVIVYTICGFILYHLG